MAQKDEFKEYVFTLMLENADAAEKVWYPALDGQHFAEEMVKEGLLKSVGSHGFSVTPKGCAFLKKARAAKTPAARVAANGRAAAPSSPSGRARRSAKGEGRG